MVEWNPTVHTTGVIPLNGDIAAKVNADAYASEVAFANGNMLGALSDAELAAQLVHLISGDTVTTQIGLFGFKIFETGPHYSLSISEGLFVSHANAVGTASASGGPVSYALGEADTLAIGVGGFDKAWAFAFGEALGNNAQTSAVTSVG